MACGIVSYGMQTLCCGLWDLVPQPGIECGPSAFGVWSLSHWTTREVPLTSFWKWETWQYWAYLPTEVGWLAWEEVTFFAQDTHFPPHPSLPALRPGGEELRGGPGACSRHLFWSPVPSKLEATVNIIPGLPAGNSSCPWPSWIFQFASPSWLPGQTQC